MRSARMGKRPSPRPRSPRVSPSHRRENAPSRRFSRTLSSRSVPRPSGTYAMPSRANWRVHAPRRAAHRALPAPASAQLLQHKDLSLSVALAIANGALDACKAMGYAASVVVVDRGGDTLVALRGDGSGPHTVENARRKAYTANTFKMTTEAFLQEMKTRPVRREQTTLPNVIAINGGVPIKVGDDVIGGVGLSGSPGKDEECVNAGLEKVKQQLQ